MTPKLASNVLMELPVEQAIAAAVQYLRAHGYAIMAPGANVGEEFTVGELCAVLGLPHATLHKRLAHPHCPPAPRRLGPRGKTLAVTLSPALEAWLSKPKQPGRKLATT